MNGPPQIGKDTIARILIEHKPHVKSLTLSHEIRSMCAEFYNDSRFETHWDVQGWKDSHIEGLANGFSTPRQALIHFSERVIKPTEGQDYFAKHFAAQCKSYNNALMTDLGFQVEADALADAMDLVIIVQLHHPDFNFDNDSRQYITSSASNVVTIEHHTKRENPQYEAGLILDKIIDEVESYFR
ncbi:dNMP kinase [Vibrio phage vB_VpaM_VPs20]|uniref:DNMP kinase n=1 Tax=Vibrio phage vB_VpaM_VPs20 TaxID=2978980 RepID=A0A9X9JSI0_9CAUD|nr:dNMP kinase [Vibrio phage vB_VpaM_VPs20]UYD72110.1 dNMP kinase [Vibrio phage vB_VpaM_VPs20]